MRVVAADLGEDDAKLLKQCKARASEAVEYCLATKPHAGAHRNPANLEAALHFQRMLEQTAWEVDDVHRLSNVFTTGRFHENVTQSALRFAVGRFVKLVHRAARKASSGPAASGS